MCRLEPGIEIEETEIIKANDQTLHAFVIKPEDSKAAPTIYIDEYYKAYAEGNARIADIASGLINAYKDAVGLTEGTALEKDPNVLTSKKNLYIRVLDPDLNRKFLEDKCWKESPDGMALVACIAIDDDDGGFFSTVVTKNMATEFHIDPDTLVQEALDNAPEYRPAVLMDPERAMGWPPSSLTDDADFNLLNSEGTLGHNASLILTVNTGKYGAAALYYAGIAEKIALMLGSGYYALPSSQHEMFIISDAKESVSKEMLETMLKDGNRVVCTPDDVLTDKVFHIDSCGRIM